MSEHYLTVKFAHRSVMATTVDMSDTGIRLLGKPVIDHEDLGRM